MDKALQDTVAAIAFETRMWVQAKADQANYHPDDLLGWCAIAASELSRRLNTAGIPTTIYVKNEYPCHCYCMVDDYVVDVTATQFREYKDVEVLILHSKEAEVNEYHCGTMQFGTGAELRVYQQKTRWPSCQLAFA